MVAFQKMVSVNVPVNVSLDGKVLNARSTSTTVQQIHVSTVASAWIKLTVTSVIAHQEPLDRDVSVNHIPVLRTRVNLEAASLVLAQAMVSNVDVTKDGTVNIVTFLHVTIPCVKMVARQCQTSFHIPMTRHADVNALKGLPDDIVRTLSSAMLRILAKMAVSAILLMAKTLGVSAKMVLSGNFVSVNLTLVKTTHVSTENALPMKTIRLNASAMPIGLVQTVISMWTSAPLVATIPVNMAHVLTKKAVTDVNVILDSKVIDVKRTLTIALSIHVETVPLV